MREKEVRKFKDRADAFPDAAIYNFEKEIQVSGI